MREMEYKKPPLCEELSGPVASNRRQETRGLAQGGVQFFIEGQSAESNGQLVDISNSGFRASHETRTLQPGQLVGFEHAHAQGVARVIWTRILGTRVESGFLILDRDRSGA